MEAARPRIIGIPIDEGHGNRYSRRYLKKLKSGGKIAKPIYAIPTGQSPTGITLGSERHKHLLEIALKYDLFVVGDGVYNYLVCENIGTRSLKSMDRGIEWYFRNI